MRFYLIFVDFYVILEDFLQKQFCLTNNFASLSDPNFFKNPPLSY